MEKNLAFFWMIYDSNFSYIFPGKKRELPVLLLTLRTIKKSTENTPEMKLESNLTEEVI